MGKDTVKAKKRGLFGLKARKDAQTSVPLLEKGQIGSMNEGKKEPSFDYDVALKSQLKKAKAVDKKASQQIRSLKSTHKSEISSHKAAIKEINAALKADFKQIKTDTKTTLQPLLERLEFLNQSILSNTENNPFTHPNIDWASLDGHPVKAVYDEHNEAFDNDYSKLINAIKKTSKQWAKEHENQLGDFKLRLKKFLQAEKAQEKNLDSSIKKNLKDIFNTSQKNSLKIDELKDISAKSIDRIAHSMEKLSANQSKHVHDFEQTLFSQIQTSNQRFTEHFKELKEHLNMRADQTELTEEKTFVSDLINYLAANHQARKQLLDALLQSFTNLHTLFHTESTTLQTHLTHSLKTLLPQWHEQLTAWYDQFSLYPQLTAGLKKEALFSMAHIVKNIEKDYTTATHYFYDYYQFLIEHYEESLNDYTTTYKALFEEQLFLDNIDVFAEDWKQKAEQFAKNKHDRLKDLLNSFELEFEIQQRENELDYQQKLLELKAQLRSTPYEQNIAQQNLWLENQQDRVLREKQLDEAVLSLEQVEMDKHQEQIESLNTIEKEITELKKQHLMSLSLSIEEEEKEHHRIVQQAAKDKKAIQQKIITLERELNNLEKEHKRFEENVSKDGQKTIQSDLADLIEKKELLLSQIDGYEIDLKESLKVLQKQSKDSQSPYNQALKQFESNSSKLNQNFSALANTFEKTLKDVKTSINAAREDSVALSDYSKSETVLKVKSLVLELIEYATQSHALLLNAAPLDLSDKKIKADSAAFGKLIEAKTFKHKKTLEKTFDLSQAAASKQNSTKLRNSLFSFVDFAKQSFYSLHEIIEKELGKTQSLLKDDTLKALEDIEASKEKQKQKFESDFNKKSKKLRNELQFVERAFLSASEKTLQSVYESYSAERDALVQRRKALNYELSDTEIALNRHDDDVDYLLESARLNFSRNRDDLKYEQQTLLHNLNHKKETIKQTFNDSLESLKQQKLKLQADFDSEMLTLQSKYKQELSELEQFYKALEAERKLAVQNHEISYQKSLTEAINSYKTKKSEKQEAISLHEQWTLNIALNLEEILKAKKTQSLQNFVLLEKALQQIQIDMNSRYEEHTKTINQKIQSIHPKEPDTAAVHTQLQQHLESLENDLIIFANQTYKDITNLLGKGGSK